MGHRYKLKNGKMVLTKAKSGYVIAASAKSARVKWNKKKAGGAKKRRSTGTKRRYRRDYEGKSCRGRSKACGRKRYVYSGGKAVRNSKATAGTYVLSTNSTTALKMLKEKGLA